MHAIHRAAGRLLARIPMVMPERLQAFVPATPLGHLFDGRLGPGRLAFLFVAMAVGIALQLGGLAAIRRRRPAPRASATRARPRPR